MLVTALWSIGIALVATTILFIPVWNYHRAWNLAEKDRKTYIEHIFWLHDHGVVDLKQYTDLNLELASVDLREHALYREFFRNPLELYPLFKQLG